MNSTEIFLAILGIVGAIVAALAGAGFGAWRTEKTATKLAKEQEFRNACRNFRNAFTKLRVELDDADGNKAIVLILRPYRIKLKETMIEFMGILHKQKQISLKSAWISFSGEDYKDKTYKEQFYQYNIHYGAKGKSLLEIRDIAVKNIEELLEFATYKSQDS